MVSADKILRTCSVCKLVEVEEYNLLPSNSSKIEELISEWYKLSHCFLSSKCADNFHEEYFAEVEDIYVPGLKEGQRIYERCE